MGIRILVPRPHMRGPRGTLRKFVWAALGVALWGTAYTLFGAEGLAGVVRARRQVEALEQRVQQARAQNHRLEQQIQLLRHDPEAIERTAREKLYLAKPGETVYLLPPLPEELSPPSDDARPPADGPSDDARQR